MLNQSIEYSQTRKKPTKKAMNIQEPASMPNNRLNQGDAGAAGGSRSNDAVAMEDLLDLGEIGRERACSS